MPRLQYQLLQALYAEPQPAADEEPIHSGPGCSLLELSAEKCRWPISTPGAEDFCFCGNMPVEGLPYCAGHTRLAYRPGSARASPRGKAGRMSSPGGGLLSLLYSATGLLESRRRYRATLQSGRSAPETSVNAPSTSSATSRRLASTGPGMLARPLGITLKPTRP